MTSAKPYPSVTGRPLGSLFQRLVHRTAKSLTPARRRALERVVLHGETYLGAYRPVTVNWLVQHELIERVGDPDREAPEHRYHRGIYKPTVLGHEVHGRIEAVPDAEYLAHAENDGRQARRCGWTLEDARIFDYQYATRSAPVALGLRWWSLVVAFEHGWLAEDERVRREERTVVSAAQSEAYAEREGREARREGWALDELTAPATRVDSVRWPYACAAARGSLSPSWSAAWRRGWLEEDERV